MTSYILFLSDSKHEKLSSKHHTNRSDLTPQFHLLDPTMVYNIETATYNDYGARIPGATLWRTIEATGAT